MRHRLALAALLLPLAGCVVPPPGPAMYPYAQPGYGAPGPYAQQDFSYPGYAYNDGSPTYVEGGVTWPLIFYGGGWGYWDGFHRWHGAPGPVGNWLGARHPGGVGYRPFGGGQWGRPGGWGGRAYGPAGGGGPGFRPGGGGPGFRSGGAPGVRPASGGGRPAAAPSHQRDEHR
jgi:hypothetical protein